MSKKPKVAFTRLSDNLLTPQVYVAEIRKWRDGFVEWTVQFVGRDEGKMCVWKEAASVREARAAVKAAVKASKGASKGARL